MRGWLGGKATTIFGGSQEIQNNIISKRILGLPDTTQSTCIRPLLPRTKVRGRGTTKWWRGRCSPLHRVVWFLDWVEETMRTFRAAAAPPHRFAVPLPLRVRIREDDRWLSM